MSGKNNNNATQEAEQFASDLSVLQSFMPSDSEEAAQLTEFLDKSIKPDSQPANPKREEGNGGNNGGGGTFSAGEFFENDGKAPTITDGNAMLAFLKERYKAENPESFGQFVTNVS